MERLSTLVREDRDFFGHPSLREARRNPLGYETEQVLLILSELYPMPELSNKDIGDWLEREGL